MKDKIKDYIFIFIVAIIVCIPLFNKNYNIFIDDGIQHVCRLIGTFESIAENQKFPVIMSNFCNGFGYSWNIFYSPITAYVPLLFKLFTSSYIICIKLFMLLVTFLSGITMYEFLKKITKNKFAGLLGAVIYILAPYRLTDMYIRMALAELTSFVFLPMVFHGLYNIINDDKNRKTYLLCFGAVGLILTHTVIAMYTAIISAIYVLINIKNLKDKTRLKSLIVNALLIIGITSFFWVPMLEHKVNAEYEVFKQGRMERTEVLTYYKLSPLQLIYTQEGKMIFEIGIITIIGVLLTLLAIRKIDKKYKNLYLFSLITGIICIIMSLKVFPFERLPSILKMIQFSFRMLEFSAFFLSVVSAINYSVTIKDFRWRDVLVLTFILIILSFTLTNHIKYNNNIDENKLIPAVPVNQNTKRVHAGCASFEYLPCNAFENLDYIKTRENKVNVLEGDVSITNEDKNGTYMKFDIHSNDNKIRLELPYIYYLGYNIYVTQENGEKKNIIPYESEKGFIEIELNNIKTGTIYVNYTGTNLMRISAVVSMISFSALILLWKWGTVLFSTKK